MPDMAANHPEIKPDKYEPLYGDPTTKDQPRLVDEVPTPKPAARKPARAAQKPVVATKPAATAPKASATPETPQKPAEGS